MNPTFEILSETYDEIVQLKMIASFQTVELEDPSGDSLFIHEDQIDRLIEVLKKAKELL